MDLDDIGMHYREIILWKRILLLFIVAITPAAYEFYSRWPDLDTAQKLALEIQQTELKKLEDAEEKRKKITRLEEEVVGLESQLKDASKKLPDKIYIDNVLKKTELVAQELGLVLNIFHPKEEVPSETAFRFIKLPISIELVGTYAQIASFFDHMVHLDFIVEIENIDLTLVDGKDKSNADIDDEYVESSRRSKVRLRVSCDMMIFRMMTQQEAETIQTMNKEKQKAENPGAIPTPGVPPTPGVSPTPGSPVVPGIPTALPAASANKSE